MKRPDKPTWLKVIVSRRLLVFVSLCLIDAYIAYKRYPTYIAEPNFYAEDGTVFAQNITDQGFLKALLTPFNGYFIVGIYLLEGVAFLLNNLFGHGNFLNLPTALAVTSYGFWGLLSSLPALLFWNDFKRKIWLVGVCISLALLPLPAFNYAILGTVGNYKFAFLFIAFLLLIKRLRLQPNNRWIYVLDASLVICAFTNATVYLLLPAALLPYWPGLKRLFTKSVWLQLLKTASFISLLALYAFSAIQLIFVALRGGVDDLDGYLQEPYEIGKTIEILFHRTLLFPFDQILSKHLNDLLVVGLTTIFLFIIFRFARRDDRMVAGFGLYASLVASVLFISQRPGVSQFFDHYQSTATDHFFYTQNLIFLFTVTYVLGRSAEIHKRAYPKLLVAGMVCFLIAGAFIHNDFSKNAHMNRLTGDIRYATQKTCLKDHDQDIEVPVYPVSAQFLHMDGTHYCPQVADYTPRRGVLPMLVPFNNRYIPVNAARVTQTIIPEYNQLSGVSVFLSTFGGAGKSTYKLSLLDAHCKKTLRSTVFIGKDAVDNSYHDLRFEPIEASKGQRYCFTIRAAHMEPNLPPVAIQLSAPDIYTQGVAARDGTSLSEDVVFDLLYR